MNPDEYRAASTNNSSFFEKLTNPSSTLLQVTTEKNTVLHVALQCEQFHVVEELVRLRPSLVYEKNSKGNTPLHVAVRWAGASSMVKLIIQKAKDQRDVETGGQQLLSIGQRSAGWGYYLASCCAIWWRWWVWDCKRTNEGGSKTG